MYISNFLNSSWNEKCFRQTLYRKSKHTLCSITFFPKIVPFMRQSGKIFYSRTRHIQQHNMVHGSRTLIVCNTHCFSTAKMVRRTRLSVKFLRTLSALFFHTNIIITDTTDSMRVLYGRGATELTQTQHPLFRNSLTKCAKGNQHSGNAAVVVTKPTFRNFAKTPKNENTAYTQNNGAVSKINKKFLSHLTRAQRTPSAAATVHVSQALLAVRFSCLLRGRGASFKDGVQAGKRFLCAPF